jgi:hypothetical protein
MSYNAPPPPPGYGYGNPPQARGNGLAVAGLVCGIVGILILNIILGPLAIIFGGVALSRANKGAPRKTMSLWAIGLGILDVVLFIVLLVSFSNGFYLHFNSSTS